MEVKTGKILAIANLTRTTEGRYDERLNFAVGEATEPGSTFKLASLLALLDNGVLPDAKVDLNKGRWKFYNHNMYDSDYPHEDREVTLRDAFVRSSNVGIARLVDEHFGDRKEDFTKALSRMRLQHKLGIEVLGEATPYVKLDPKSTSWSGTTLPWMSTGYELQLTPLQILNLYNAVANDGRMMRPYLVSEIRRDGRVEEHISPTVLADRIASPKAIEQAQEMLAAVVEEGTAKRLRDEDYAIAGKTGTAKLVNRESSYRDRIYQASFAGYFPAEDPAYSCIVVIADPSKGGYYGGSVAGPVFKEISDKIHSSKLDLHPALLADVRAETLPAQCVGYRRDIHTVCEQLDLPFTASEEGAWLTARNADSVLVLHTLDAPDDKVPDVRGMNLRDALYLLENRGLKVEVEGRGHVRAQSIRHGTPVRSGAVVKIRLS
jgi:cell division protein FtsI (penicillin-binding protein 3)